MAKRGKTRVGMDVGSTSIKLVELLHLGDRHYEVIHWAIQPISPGPFVDQAAQALKMLIQRYQLEHRPIRAALNGPAVVIRFLELPKLKPGEVEQAVRFEAEPYLPFSIEDARLASWMIGDLPQGKIRVLAVAAKREAVEAHLGLLQQARLRCELLDAEPVALVNAYLANPPAQEASRNEEGAVALVHLGARVVHVNILVNGAFCFSRTMAWDGSQLGEAQEGPAPAWDELGQQLERSCDFVESQFAARPGAIVCSGGGATARAAGHLTSRLGAPALVWNPMRDWAIRDRAEGAEVEASAPQLAVACGLAVRP